jgi:hypothetical protein
MSWRDDPETPPQPRGLPPPSKGISIGGMKTVQALVIKWILKQGVRAFQGVSGSFED